MNRKGITGKFDNCSSLLPKNNKLYNVAYIQPLNFWRGGRGGSETPCVFVWLFVDFIDNMHQKLFASGPGQKSIKWYAQFVNSYLFNNYR